ncbi:MAG: hypothetical protein OEM02_13035 [Desulfobulbaceae bacterium]|nr:hypothetical protein [Desulfobulbaceae bacterium]
MIFQVIVEYSESGDVFQVTELHDESGTDYGFLIPYDERFLSMVDLGAFIAYKLKLEPSEIELEEV